MPAAVEIRVRVEGQPPRPLSRLMNQPLPRRTALRTAAVLVVGTVGASTVAACTDPSDGTERSPGPDADAPDSEEGSGILVVAADQRAGVVGGAASCHDH